MKIAIIGAGPAGMLAGGFLSSNHEVHIFDKNEKCGKKLYITGKGRCNLTNNCNKDEFFNNVVNGKKFMYSSINQFSPEDIISFFENIGLKLKTERGNRIFPKSDKSSDVIKALEKFSKDCKIHLNEKVEKISKKNEEFLIKTHKKEYLFDRVIISTGGISYPLTGSTGDGYKFAEEFGHTITKPKPALVAIELKDWFIKDLQGISLKNVKIKATSDYKNYEYFGEMLFTDKGISGPIVLTLSSFINRANDIKLSLDFKPALSEDKLLSRILRDVDQCKNKTMSNFVSLYLPKTMANIFLKLLNIDNQQKVNSFTVKQRENFIKLLKNFSLTFKNLYPIESAIITSGGVALNEINPKTMESKLVKGLYFIGEVLDVDCLTGGFNLTQAFSTAYACSHNLT